MKWQGTSFRATIPPVRSWTTATSLAAYFGLTIFLIIGAVWPAGTRVTPVGRVSHPGGFGGRAILVVVAAMTAYSGLVIYRQGRRFTVVGMCEGVLFDEQPEVFGIARREWTLSEFSDAYVETDEGSTSLVLTRSVLHDKPSRPDREILLSNITHTVYRTNDLETIASAIRKAIEHTASEMQSKHKD